jgi:hypothetical protein
MATKKKKPEAPDMDARIREFFERNYELLRMESGQVLTNELKQEALNQVLFYYKKMKHVAENVTRTEVRLALPEQRTAQGRRFTIEGVVDVVEEGEETWLYDIKTHDPDYVRQHPERYEEQLNVYAHIWQNLQRQPLHHTAIIATQYPRAMKQAWRRGDMPAFLFEFERWDPLIELPFDQGRLEETLSSFGDVVDRIEGKEYGPRTEADLEAGGKRKFGTRVCRNCDARFSCSSYRAFARKRKTENPKGAKYFTDPASDADQNDWLDGNLTTESDLLT